MKILLLAAALLISGPAVVLDGDTVAVAGVHIRLKGVDAPKLASPLGEIARQVMIDTWRREVGYCTTADGIDINRAIIEQGAALSCPRFDPRYLPFEQPAALAAHPHASYCLPRR